MTREELSLVDTYRVVAAILASTGAVFGLIFLSYVCVWCFKKEPKTEEEQMLRAAHLASESPQGVSNSGMKKKNLSDNPDDQPVQGIDYQLGKLQYGVSYNERNQELCLKIFRAIGLPSTDISGFSDPYVRISILPVDKKEFRTQIRKNKLNPVWNESFLFQGWNRKQLQDKTIYLIVLDFDRLKQDDMVGEIFVPLNSIDLNIDTTAWQYLQPCKDNTENRLGEVFISLCYDPTEGKLTFGMIRCKNLLMMDVTGASDPFVKINVIVNGKRTEKRKTVVKHNSTNPVYNDVFTFNLSAEKIGHTYVEVVVMDYDQFDNNDRIGSILLGSDTDPPESRHWNDMLFHPQQISEGWHALKAGEDN